MKWKTANKGALGRKKTTTLKSCTCQPLKADATAKSYWSQKCLQSCSPMCSWRKEGLSRSMGRHFSTSATKDTLGAPMVFGGSCVVVVWALSQAWSVSLAIETCTLWWVPQKWYRHSSPARLSTFERWNVTDSFFLDASSQRSLIGANHTFCTRWMTVRRTTNKPSICEHQMVIRQNSFF